MLNKKLIFALIIFIIAISAVSASDFNTTADDYGYANLNAVSQNVSDVSISDSNEGSELAEMDSDVLGEDRTVYFDASASSDGVGTKSSPYKFLSDDRITSGMTAYFADGVYLYSGTAKIDSNTLFIGQSRDKTIIKSNDSYSFDLILLQNSNLVLRDLTFDYGHIISNGNVDADNVCFNNSVRSYNPNTSSVGEYACGGVIFSSPSDASTCSITFKNCYFDSNHAKHGGVIFAEYTDVVVTNCVFYNSSSNRSGGVIYASNSNVSISKSSFTRNAAKYGGAIYGEFSAINMIDSNFTTSQAYSFGGVVSSQYGTLTSNKCVFNNYGSLTDSGGAIYSEICYVDVSESTFKSGIADYGGAICALNTDLKVYNSNFEDNAANYGGSIFNMYGTAYIWSNNFKSSTSNIRGDAICSYLADVISIINNNFTNSDEVYVFVKSYATEIVDTGNSGLTNVIVVNTTLFDLSSYVVAPIINYSPESQSNLPSYYNSNDYGYVTPVKDQMDGGNCWAFTAIATLEACLKKATGITYDFSEENIKNVMALYSLVGRTEYPNDGGYDSMAFSYFTSWLGPIYDDWDEYDDYSALTSMYSSLLHVQNVYFLPDRKDTSDNDNIKRAIMDYGAVAASYKWDEGHHSITLVGWNDNYNDYDYFDNYSKGVWIIKNSWGPESDDHGYVYVSYDMPFKTESSNSSHNYLYTFIFNDTEGYARNYQYEITGLNNYIVSSDDVVKYKNVFFAQDDEILSAFSTVFKEPTRYLVSVYKGNDLLFTQEGYSPAGYYTIPLINKTALSKGDQFTICIQNLNSGEKFIPVCDALLTNLGTFLRGISYVNYGNEWSDLYSCYQTPIVACIKAFTTPLTLNEVMLTADKFGEVYVNEDVIINFTLSDDNLNGGFVTVSIDGKTYYANVSGGRASLKVRFDTVKSYDLTANYKNNLYDSNKVSFNFNVVKDPGAIVIVAQDVIKYYGGSDELVVKVTQGGAALSGAKVKVSAEGLENFSTTDSNGQASFNLNLPVGTHTVTVTYANKSATSKFTVKTTVDASDSSYNYGATYLKAKFHDSNGAAISSKRVSFKIGSAEYLATTGSDGIASYKVALARGTYVVTVTNPVTGEKKNYTLTVNKETPAISIAYSVNNEDVNLTASLSDSSATGKVVFTVGGKDYERTISGGKAVLDLTLTGTYDAFATYGGDNNFNSAKSDTISFTCSPAASQIELSAPDLTKYYGSSTNFAIRVTDGGQPVYGANVTYTRDGKNLYPTTNKDGYAYVNVSFYPGTYHVTSSYGGKSVASTITIKSTIAASDLVYTYGGAYLKATFYNTDGSVLSNAQVKFKIGTAEYSTTTDSNGLASYYIGLNAGVYEVTAINPVNGETESFKLTVSKATRTLTLKQIELNGIATVRATLSQASATGSVVFTLNGNEYSREISNGISDFQIGDYSGTFTVDAKYSGDSNFNSCSNSISVTIEDKTPKVSVKGITKVYGDSKQLVVTVCDYNDTSLPNQDVSIKIYKGSSLVKIYSLKTNLKGQIKLGCNFKAGNYKAYVDYGETHKSVNVVVKKASSKLYASSKAYKVKASAKKITVVLKNNKNKVIGNAKVSIIVGGKTYAAKTKNSGKATLNLKKLTRKGTFRAVVKFAGDAYYNAVSKAIKIYVR